jgi:hypothetical protein
MNIDYSFCQALKQVLLAKRVIFVYDVGCEWHINFRQRVDASGHLYVREDLEVITAVGKFHLGAHIQKCFARFSLNFVQGVGQLDGEVLESLWSSLNKAASHTRGMSQPHRQEILDSYMQDSNWKKMSRACKQIPIFSHVSLLMTWHSTIYCHQVEKSND